jgi:hypothetical protein
VDVTAYNVYPEAFVKDLMEKGERSVKHIDALAKGQKMLLDQNIELRAAYNRLTDERDRLRHAAKLHASNLEAQLDKLQETT